MNNGISTSSNETSYQVTGLYPFTVYSFRVLAVNAMGRSRASKESYYMVTLREGECDSSYVRPFLKCEINPLNPELNPICYLLALLRAHHFLHVSRIRVKSLSLRLLMSYIYIYIYGAPILDVSRSHTTTQHSR